MRAHLLIVGVMSMACAAVTPLPSVEDAQATVTASERAFAQTMADRNLDAFATFVSEDAIFFTDGEPLRGRAAVVEAWSSLYEGAEAPFAWAPDQVEVLPSGDFAFSSGPVTNGAGQTIARFSSIWRLEKDGEWRVVFDKGNPVCAESQ